MSANSCFVYPSDFDPVAFSRQMEAVFGEAPTPTLRQEHSVDYYSLSIAEAPSEAPIDFSCDKFWFLSFATKNERSGYALSENLAKYRKEWERLGNESQTGRRTSLGASKRKGMRAPMKPGSFHEDVTPVAALSRGSRSKTVVGEIAKPVAPMEKPAPPSVKPTPPAEKPVAPAVKPAPPSAKPAPPAAKPAPPAEKPAPPSAKPAPPAAKPAPPSAKPAPPAAKPAPPAEKPVPPSAKPAAPAEKPAPPPKPAAPAEKPAPPKPAAPVEKPAPPAKPAETPAPPAKSGPPPLAVPEPEAKQEAPASPKAAPAKPLTGMAARLAMFNQLKMPMGGAMIGARPMGSRPRVSTRDAAPTAAAPAAPADDAITAAPDDSGQVARPAPQIVRCARRRGAVRPPSALAQPQ